MLDHPDNAVPKGADKGCQKAILKMLHELTREPIVLSEEKSCLQLTTRALSVMKHNGMVELKQR